MIAFRLFVLVIALWMVGPTKAHPLKLSLCEIEYSSKNQLLTINLKLFLTDVNEAITFDPDSKKLAFCQPNESKEANKLLLNYLNQFFHVKANSNLVNLKIKDKSLKGEGDNTSLWISFEYIQRAPLKSIEIKNAVFTDLFFDQNNIVYVHVDKKSKSLMLDKKKSIHQLKF
jgi:hypothetical protein|tara:strand:- start:315 stop:830 length:516 start_codon:yes stop_codon:yes gene_type:complete